MIKTLTELLEDGAKDELNCKKEKEYSYKIFEGFLMNKLAISGKCIVTNIYYDRHKDCDIYMIKDIDTNKRYSCNQFALELKEL